MSTQITIEEILRLQVDPCERRHKGAETSREAHERVLPGKKLMHDRIMNLARARKGYGITVHEVSGAFGKTPNCVSGRLSELRALGKLKKSGERRGNAAVLVEA